MSSDAKGLCFFKLNGNLWPAFKYSDGRHLIEDAKDEIDNPTKARIGLEMIQSHLKGEAPHAYVQPMGKSVSVAITVEDAEDECVDVYLGMTLVLKNETINPNVFKDENEYLEFMDAMAHFTHSLERLSENEPLRGATDPKHIEQWRERAQTVLKEAKDTPRQEATREEEGEAFTATRAPDDDMLVQEEGLSTPDKVVQNRPARDHSARKEEAESAMQVDDESTPKMSQQAPANGQSSQEESDETNASDNEKSTSGNTPKAANTRPKSFHSSNATVVSYNENSLGEESDDAERVIPFDDPEIEDSDTLQRAGNKLVMNSGWNRRTVNGEVLYWMPNVTFNKGIRGKDLFNIDELEEYLKGVNLWKSETARQLIFTPIQKTRKKTKESKPLSVTPARSSVRRSTRSRGSSSKKRSLPRDEFYFFANLMQFLEMKLDWEYKKGVKVGSDWVYIRGDSELGVEGTRGVDYFTEEHEVVDYCTKNKYKTKYRHLLTPPSNKRSKQGIISP